MRIKLLIVVWVLSTGCYSARRWVTPEDLREGHSTLVFQAILRNGDTVRFDETLGWFDKASDDIEGRSLRRSGPDTLRLQDVKSVDISVERIAITTTTVLITLALAVGLIWYVVHSVAHGF